MDAGDWIAGAALAVSLLSAGFTWRSSSLAKRYAEDARRSADAAERPAARLAERAGRR